MLLNLREYYRPGDATASGRAREGLDQALALLARASGQAVPLAGGDSLLASGDPAIGAVVDLQGLGLDEIAIEEDRVRIGAMVTRSALGVYANAFREAGDRDARARELGLLGMLVAQAAARWSGSTQRNRATVGGAVAVGASDDLLVIALLAAGSTVVLRTAEGTQEVTLADFLSNRRKLLAEPALITDLILTLPPIAGDAASVGTAIASVARTPADTPIVAAVAVVWRAEDRCVRAELALGGVGKEPVRVRAARSRLDGAVWSQTLIAEIAGEIAIAVHPEGDFRGSAEYRTAMAKVLSERALMEAWERAK